MGLDNIGNTCYINAVVQSLFHTPLFREFFISKNFLMHLPIKSEETTSKTKDQDKEKQMSLAQAFAELLLDTATLAPDKKKNTLLSIAPIAFKKVVNQHLPMFFGSQ
jgi:ubiquitin C-terminal hydrolase